MKPLDIYGTDYAASYRHLYIDHPQWEAKHRHNLTVLTGLVATARSWLDTCCGQAWHFAHVGEAQVAKTGIDISAAQLAAAQAANPDATFIQADLQTFEFDRGFDLVTNFWGAYSYLDDEQAIERLMRKLIRWTNTGGSVYVELITPEALAAYVDSEFSRTSGTATARRSEDFVKWSFTDPGGTHLLTSPPEEFFLDIFRPHFRDVDSRSVVTTMRQLVATGRLEGE
ncbi:MAG: class I SAM-dependent methyltransferase [Vicinamibacteria bacterium]